jgi:hypothetical protein
MIITKTIFMKTLLKNGIIISEISNQPTNQPTNEQQPTTNFNSKDQIISNGNRLSLLVLMLILLIPTYVKSQVFPPPHPPIQREDILNSTKFNNLDRQQLATEILNYITAQTITDHCDMRAISGGNIHSDFDFLPFHRAYLQGLEDYLTLKGLHQFVPLPAWDPSIACPTEFRIFDQDCYQANCSAMNGMTNDCSQTSLIWAPSLTKPFYLTLPPIPGNNNDLCDWSLNPLLPSSMDCCGFGLSNIIEGDFRGPHNPSNNIPGFQAIGYHNSVHADLGGLFKQMISPTTPAFWIWHAYVDQIWKDWEDNCSNSNLADYDLYMKDHPYYVMSERDMGNEPSIYNGDQYLSYDIWCRPTNDGLTNATHQNPVNDGINPTHVYIRIRNRGKYTSQGTEQLKIYWAKAGTSLSWPNSWNGSQLIQNASNTGLISLGDQMGTITIPQIEPMNQEILHFVWQPSSIPNPSDYNNFNNQPHHFCLLARIEDPNGNDVMYNEQTTGVWNLGNNVQNNNNIIWKNMSIIDQNPTINSPNSPNQEVYTSANFYVGNRNSEPVETTFDLVFENIERRSGNKITEDADLTIQLEQSVWDIWEDGGFQSNNLDVIDEENHFIRITGNTAKLENLLFPVDFIGTINLGFNFLTEKFPYENEYDFNVRQVMYNEGNEVTVGGEGFKIYPPIRSGFLADAGIDCKISVGDTKELIAADIGEDAIYNWYDESGELIDEGKNIFVSPIIEHEYKLEVIANEDGIKDYDKITIGIRESQILSVNPNPASDQIDINYELENVTVAYVLILKPYGGSYQYSIDVNAANLNIDLSGYQPGIYHVSLVCDGVSVDSENLIIN